MPNAAQEPFDGAASDRFGLKVDRRQGGLEARAARRLTQERKHPDIRPDPQATAQQGRVEQGRPAVRGDQEGGGTSPLGQGQPAFDEGFTVRVRRGGVEDPQMHAQPFTVEAETQAEAFGTPLARRQVEEADAPVPLPLEMLHG
jgi:hypothetical protein